MENPEIKCCQNCRHFKQPKCNVTNEFKARKTESCDQYIINKKRKIRVINNKVEEVKKTDDDLKREILGEQKIFKNAPFERPKMNRSQRRK